MGIEFTIACDATKEKIDPARIDGFGSKAGPIAHPNHPLGALAVFAMLYRWAWSPVRLAADGGDDSGYYDYTDVTDEVIEEYNHFYGTELLTKETP